MKRILLAFAVGVSLYSCKEAVSVPMDKEIKVVQTSEVYQIDDLFCDFKLLPLNTGTEGLFRNVNKLVYHDGHYYILDKSGKKQVLVFDRNGNYERSIGRVGRGQGEYTNIEDFTIDEDGGRLVILAYPSLVYVYDMEGRFLEQKKIEEHSMLWNIASHKHGFVCATNHQTYTEGEHAFPHGRILVRWERRGGEIALTVRCRGVRGKIVVPAGYAFAEGGSERAYGTGGRFTVRKL